MPQQVHIIDYGMGNIFSIEKRFLKLGAEVIISSNPEDLRCADKIILPGVGHFTRAMENLEKNNLIEVLNECVLVKKKPILGICLGMQLMASQSEEGNANGLNWIPGTVKKFSKDDHMRLKIPQIGWNSIENKKKSRLMTEIEDGSEFYFVHSFHFQPDNLEHVLNSSSYTQQFCSAVEKENIFGVQYHPEKSHDQGLQLFKNFLSI